MNSSRDSFNPSLEELTLASELLDLYRNKNGSSSALAGLPKMFPEDGMGDEGALRMLAPWLIGEAQALGIPISAAHMDPPTPWVTWATAMWKAALNQNLLHAATSPAARVAESIVVSWIAPFFTMAGGQMTAGSSLANLTALWAARDIKRVRQVIASDQAHISIKKAAHILGLAFHEVKSDENCRLDLNQLSTVGNISESAIVLTAGTTATGTIDPLHAKLNCAWTHVDAAWSGPLRFSSRHQGLLNGIETADSITISAHKWLFQPKDSALILFRDWDQAKSALSFGSGYLTDPNVGVMGSKGAMAEPLLATLLSWGKNGLEYYLHKCMDFSIELTEQISNDPQLELFLKPESGVVVWRPRNKDWENSYSKFSRICSKAVIKGSTWVRNVAANPSADAGQILNLVRKAI